MVSYSLSDVKKELSHEWYRISDDGVSLTSGIVFNIWLFLQDYLGDSRSRKFVDFSKFVCKDFYVLLQRIYHEPDYATLSDEDLFDMIKSYIEDELNAKLVAYVDFDYVIFLVD